VAAFVSVGAEHARERTALQQRTQSRNLWLTPAVLLENKFDEAVGTKSRKHWEQTAAPPHSSSTSSSCCRCSVPLIASFPSSRHQSCSQKHIQLLTSAQHRGSIRAVQRRTFQPAETPLVAHLHACLQNKWNNHFQEGKSSN
jgi:hypothetical protein